MGHFQAIPMRDPHLNTGYLKNGLSRKKKDKKVESVTLPASSSSSESSCEAGGLVDNVSVVILLLSLCLPLTCKIGHGKDVSEKKRFNNQIFLSPPS